MTDVADDTEDGARKRVLSNRQVLAFIASHWMRRRGLLAATVLLALVALACELCMPLATKQLVDAVSGPRLGVGRAWAAWGLFVGVFLGFTVFRNVSFRFWNPLAARNMEDMTNNAFLRVQSFSADWHADNFAGATVRRISRAMWGYDRASDAIVLALGQAAVVLAGLSIMMLLRWPLVGVFTMLVIAVYIALNLGLTSFYVRPANLRSNALDSRIGGALADAITSNPAVKSFGAERREEARFALLLAQWRAAALITWSRFINVWIIQNLVLVVLQAGLTGILVWLWSRGKATPGDVAFGVAAFLQMSGYLRNIGENVRMVQQGLDDSEDVAAYARRASDVPDALDARPLAADLGQIAFEHVTFAYRSQPEPLYRDFSLLIAPGERVALVGPTGSGKSTFVKLVQRLYDVQEGRILIDGQDISRVTQESLRRAIAVVPQDPALFHRSIGENIAYGRPDATPDEIVAAARRARAHEFILRLPKGYETLVGERGVKLSGGERQRVAIARAFLTDAPILVLDEATSSLDVETEIQVQAATDALMAGRTTIVIAHRLSTIRGADRILVFQEGRVVEEGRQGELVARGGAYARLHAVAEGTV